MERRKSILISGLSLLGLNGMFNQKFVSHEIIKKKRSQVIKTDVLIVGGGPAGIGAAIGASKAGAETLLIENHGFFGGKASFGIGMCMNQMQPNEKPRGFVHELLLQKLQNYNKNSLFE